MDKYFAFQWHITDSCDQRCKHCYIFSGDGNFPLREMPWGDMPSVIDNCAEMCAKLRRVPYFYVTGGDPMLHKDFWRLLSLFQERNIAFSILGNPFHLNGEICKRLKNCGCERYQLSLDGLRDTHDKIRKPGSFDATLEKIAVIRHAGLRCMIMTTVSGANIAELPAVIDVVVNHRADVFAFARYCPTSFEKSAHIKPEEYRALLDACWNKFDEYKNSGTVFNLKDHLWTPYLHDKGIFRIPEGLDDQMIYDGCNCGISHLTILPNGDIYACRRMDSVVGNVFADRLADVFFGEKMDAYRSFEKFEKCSKCELLRFCRGCPATAYGYTRDSYSADPQCWKEVG
ncbi:MAG: radical SAM/SPASM domain protein, ACGX system [Syntrophomonadaceae bacterium]|jgi:radical SAM/SPASM domain protein of ACGX system|nr:radical SAM/SPASM domain protein, ACGX system [Syntrophomonadaceae bacterium]